MRKKYGDEQSHGKEFLSFATRTPFYRPHSIFKMLKC